jgi:hypothetical protein
VSSTQTEGPQGNAGPSIGDPELIRSIIRWTVGLTVAVSGIVLVWDASFSLGIALGALIGGANIVLLGKAISRAFSRAAESTDDESEVEAPTVARKLPGLLRMPLLVLALAGILWYMPARPEGLATGITIVLVAAVIAGFRAKRGTRKRTL